MGDGLIAIVAAITALGALTIVARRFSSAGRYELSAVLAAAHLEAALREQDHVTIEHVVLSMSFASTIEERLRADGIDAPALREHLQAHLGPVTLGMETKVSKPARIDGRMAMLLRVAARPARSHDILLSLFDAIANAHGPDSLARALLRRSGETSSRTVDESALPRSSSPYRSPPPTAGVQVRFWNDARTTMEHVTSALVGTCALDPARARYVMFHVHFLGSAVVGAWSEAEATAIVRRVASEARMSGFTLRATLEPRGAAAPGFFARALRRRR